MKLTLIIFILFIMSACGTNDVAENNESISSAETMTPSVTEISNPETPQKQPQSYSWKSLVKRMSKNADIILTGKVRSQIVQAVNLDWVPDATETIVEIAVENIWKGNSPSIIQVKHLGGCIDDYCMSIDHQATFGKAEKVLVFLVKGENGTYSLADNESGKINLDRRYLRPETGEIEVTEDELREEVYRALERGGTE